MIAKDFDVRRFVHKSCVKQQHKRVTIVPNATTASYPYVVSPAQSKRVDTRERGHQVAAAQPQYVRPTKPARAATAFRFRNSTAAPPMDTRSRAPPPASSPQSGAQQLVTAASHKHILPAPDLHLLPEHYRPDSYVIEANKWLIFFNPAGKIPGVHEPFYHCAVEAFLFFRAQTCKNMWQILSKIKWMGMVYGHVLPNDKHQQPSLLYLRIKDTIRRINVWVKET